MHIATHRNPFSRKALSTAALAAALLTTPLAATTGAYGDSNYNDNYEDGSSYSYARVLEGTATLLEVGGDRDPLQINQPILVGDRLYVPRGSRVELALSDRTLVRIEGESELLFDSLAYSADTRDSETALRLIEGEAQVVVPQDALGEALPRIETPSATLYLHSHGTYRVAVHRRTAELTVREGLAELVSDKGSKLVHPGEMAWATEGYSGRLELATAGYRSSLERWGDELTRTAYASYDRVPYVDQSLRYAAAPLSRHGSWVELGSSYAWRPKVKVSWRPYHHGYWRTTPVGPTWVSNDPWGYVTHHYGSWDYHNRHGWLWYPGRVYSPARVTWYWGPSYVGWCPTGYYERYYRRHHNSGFNLSIGIYGTAGGHWDHFSHWSFSATINFGRRHRYHHVYTGPQLAYRHGRLEHGIITGHRGFRYQGGAHATYNHLRQEVDRRPGRSVVDVTDFVGRQPLRDNVADAVLRPATPARVATSPTLARRPAVQGDRPSRRPATTDAGSGRGNTAATRPGRIATSERPTLSTGRPGATTDQGGRRVYTRPGVNADTNRGTLGRGENTTSTRPTLGRGDRGNWYPTDSGSRGERPSAVTPPRTGERPATVTPPRGRGDRPSTVTPPRTGTRPSTVTPPRGRGDRPATVTPPRGRGDRPATVTPPRGRGDRPSTVTPPRTGTRPSTVTPPRGRPTTVTPPRSSGRPQVVTPPRSRGERPRATTPPRSTQRPQVVTPPRSRNERPRATTPPRSNQRPQVTPPRSRNERPRATTPPRSNQRPQATSPQRSRPRADRPSNNRSNQRRAEGNSSRRRDNRDRDNG